MGRHFIQGVWCISICYCYYSGWKRCHLEGPWPHIVVVAHSHSLPLVIPPPVDPLPYPHYLHILPHPRPYLFAPSLMVPLPSPIYPTFPQHSTHTYSPPHTPLTPIWPYPHCCWVEPLSFTFIYIPSVLHTRCCCCYITPPQVPTHLCSHLFFATTHHLLLFTHLHAIYPHSIPIYCYLFVVAPHSGPLICSLLLWSWSVVFWRWRMVWNSQGQMLEQDGVFCWHSPTLPYVGDQEQWCELLSGPFIYTICYLHLFIPLHALGWDGADYIPYTHLITYIHCVPTHSPLPLYFPIYRWMGDFGWNRSGGQVGEQICILPPTFHLIICPIWRYSPPYFYNLFLHCIYNLSVIPLSKICQSPVHLSFNSLHLWVMPTCSPESWCCCYICTLHTHFRRTYPFTFTFIL